MRTQEKQIMNRTDLIIRSKEVLNFIKERIQPYSFEMTEAEMALLILDEAKSALLFDELSELKIAESVKEEDINDH